MFLLLSSTVDHWAFRIVLYTYGDIADIPWNYAKFLDYAAKHRFIQRVGERYRFMHNLLQTHFAQMPLDLGDLEQFLNHQDLPSQSKN
ncbi:MAG: hypothetical protein AAGF26_06475 [Cyanobacteria bacterium P01_G01_bin.49]